MRNSFQHLGLQIIDQFFKTFAVKEMFFRLLERLPATWRVSERLNPIFASVCMILIEVIVEKGGVALVEGHDWGTLA